MSVRGRSTGRKQKPHCAWNRALPHSGSGKQNVPEDELSLATEDGEASEHHAAARNNLEDADMVQAKYAKIVESLVLAEPLERLLQRQYIHPLLAELERRN